MNRRKWKGFRHVGVLPPKIPLNHPIVLNKEFEIGRRLGTGETEFLFARLRIQNASSIPKTKFGHGHYFTRTSRFYNTPIISPVTLTSQKYEFCKSHRNCPGHDQSH